MRSLSMLNPQLAVVHFTVLISFLQCSPKHASTLQKAGEHKQPYRL